MVVTWRVTGFWVTVWATSRGWLNSVPGRKPFWSGGDAWTAVRGLNGLRVGVGAKVVEMKKIGKFAVSSFIGNVKFLVSE